MEITIRSRVVERERNRPQRHHRQN